MKAKAKRTLLILILAVIIALGFLLWRSLKEKSAVTVVIHKLERGIVTQNDQLVKSLYSEKVRSGNTVDHAEMMNKFLSMRGMQNFRISVIDVVVRGPSAIVHFRVIGEMVRDGEVVKVMNKKMTLQLGKSDGKWLIVAHGM